MLEKLKQYNMGIVNINDKDYYYKRNDAYVEILGEKIAGLFELKHAHYIPITYDNKNFYLSEDLNYKGKFSLAEDIGIYYNTIDEIRDVLMITYPNDYEKLMDQVIRMYYMDLMILNIDRSIGNYGFLKDKDNNVDLYVLDNDLSFLGYCSMMSSCDNPKRSCIVEVNNIINNFPDEYVELFYEMYNKLDKEKLEDLINETEKDINMELPHKDKYIKRFEFFRDCIAKCINNKKKELVK